MAAAAMLPGALGHLFQCCLRYYGNSTCTTGSPLITSYFKL
uniref:Uncharacterized protein n=1 Tax=Arundo donax TaxID=35708 RepID=A0A0A9BMY6_ARUDO